MVAIADGDDLVKGFGAHGARIHSEAASEVAWNAFHPLKAAEAGIARDGGEFLELNADAGGDFITADDATGELALGKVGHNSAQSAVAHEEV